MPLKWFIIITIIKMDFFGEKMKMSFLSIWHEGLTQVH